jgi:cytochrome c
MVRRTTFAVLAVAAALLSCLLATSAASAQAPAATVSVTGTATSWTPNAVTVNTGDVVRWSFTGATLPHNVHGTSANWSPPLDTEIQTGQAPVDYTFNAPGVYTFVCDVHGGMTGTVTVEDETPDALENVLVFSKTVGFRHDSIPTGIAAIQQLGTQNDFEVDATEDSAQFTDANLAQYDAVVFLSTTSDVLNDEQQAAFERYIQAGGGYVGIHAAADTEYTWPWYGEMIGGYFRNHPPGTPTASVDIADPDEPSTETVPARWTRTDEWYNYQTFVNPVVNGGGNDYSPRNSGVHVLATVDESTYDEQDGNTTDDDHPIAWCTDFDGGRAWYTGMGHTQGSFSEPDFLEHILGGIQTAAQAEDADCGEPRQSTPSPVDFEKITLDDDTENPFELDIAPDGRVFYIERNGEVNIWKPETEQTVVAGNIPVYTGEENGLMGLQLAPDFEESGWIYLTYSALPESTNQQRVSRFQMDGDTLVTSSEQVILTWQHQRDECCHSSGALDFGPDGSLYISAGDNTNPFASDGFNPIDERPGRQAWDAQRTSANTNDLNGKFMRIVPMEDIAPGATPGIGTTYTIPAGNLFPTGTAQTRPEIFAMGFRNPFRFTVDSQTGWVLMGDYGPDAGATMAGRGPQGSVEFNAITSAGNYGWPYCIRQNVAYNDFDFATGISGPPFNCAAPVNQSPNNTGLTNLPAARPATMWMGYSETDTRFPGLGTGGAPTGGPRYHFDPDNPSITKFPEFYDGEWFIGEWNNGWIKHATLNGTGDATDVRPFPYLGAAGCQQNTGANGCYKRPMDMDFGPDGSLYLIEWGSGFGGNNADSGIYRIDYVGAGRRPVAHATADPTSGQEPLEVDFSSAGSIDPDGTSLTYEWNFGDGSAPSTDPNPTHTYTATGTYTATLRVTDQSGATGVDNVQIVVGNTAPVVTITIPENGQFAEFGDDVPYEITVTDSEDGTTEDGSIDCNDVTLNVYLGHDQHSHEISEHQGCEGTFETLNASGHGESANTFTTIEAVYTDEAQPGGAIALTGRDEAILPRKRTQAEFFDTTGRAPGAVGGGDPGVQTETTGDTEGGGLNIGFIENGDYVSYEPMNLKDITSLRFRVASAGAGGTIEVRTGAADGPLVATTEFITPTGGWQTYKTVELALTSPPAGTHELFFVFRHPTDQGGLMNLNWIQFVGKGAANTTAPEVTAAADPATGTAPLQVQFDAEGTDAEGGALTYEWDFGVAGTNDDTSTDEDPTYTYQLPGTYTATVTVTDPEGAEGTASVEVRVTSSDQCPTGPVRSDEFDGDALDTNRWSVIRPDNTRPPTVSGGNLNFPIDQGSIYGPGTSARNIVVQPLPEGDVQVTAKITTEPLVENYQQAGLRVYAGDENWASVHMIHAGGARDFEFIYENANNPRNEAADKLGGIPADSPLTYWVRIVRSGNTLNAFYSFDGDEFLPVGRPADISTWDNPRIGPVALSDQAPSFPVARFDWIRFNPDGTGGGGGGGGGADIRDEFDGTALGSAWEVVRQNQDLTVSGGALRIPAQPGDLYGGAPDNAQNLTLRDAPDGPWTATAKMNFEGTQQYHQAGLLLYGNDDNFTKFGRIAHTTAGDEKFEFIYETNDTPRNEAADSTPNIAADFPDDFYVRITSDGTNITGAYSTDGSAWTPVGRPAPMPENARIGLFAFSNAAAATPVAAFDWFELDLPGGGGTGSEFSDAFDGASLDKDRWDAIVRDVPAEYTVEGGQLTITTSPGDIYTGDTSPPPNNFILQDAGHAGADWTIETKLSGTINGGYGQGGLMAYVDGDNYVKLDPISDDGSTRINRIELRSEVGSVIQNPQPNVEVPMGTTDYWIRLTKSGTTYSGEYSFDGTNWTPIAQTVANPMASPDFGIFAFGPQPAGQGDTVSFDHFLLNGEQPGGDPCQCVASGDEFDGGAIDKTRWNNIVREDASLYNVAGGTLNVTTVNGDIYQDGDPAATKNFFLQTADHAGEDWVIETRVDGGELSDGYEHAGLLAWADDDNYVKYDIISDAGNTIPNRIELRSEVGSDIQNPQPQLTPLPAGTETVSLRLTKTGTMYSGEYSFDGTNWTSIGQPVPNAMESPSFGLFTQGGSSGGATVNFEYFAVDGETGCPQEPDNEAPVIDEISASPTVGFGPLAVDFDVTASDPDEGDTLTYSWDFGDGSAPSTAEDPSHTYTAPGEYEAEVTVSDGEDDTTRTVDVQVLEPDDAGARFRTLVFSKTAGFRHSSIDEGHAAIEQLGEEENFQVDHTEDATAFRGNVLDHYDTVVWLSTTGDVLNAEQQTAFEDYIQAGGGYAGIHSAADTEYDWNWYGHLVGAYFMSHPANQTATVHVEDQEHPSTAGLPASYQRLDEWYNYKSPDFADPTVPDGDYSPRGAADIRILERLDETSYNEDDGNATDDDHPITWCQPYEGGRSWYTGQGHVEGSYDAEDPQNILQQILGGLETTAGVTPAEGCAGDPDAPTAQAFADPQTGDAPLRVQFSATGLDPQGRPVTYKWEFGDGGSVFAQSPVHTYTTPGNYTAKVTVTDEQGKTGSDTVQITVTERGNVMPMVEVAADPVSGDAPLEVLLTAQGRDPDGNSGALTYFWTFGDDSGGTAFGPAVRHRYMEPGEYTATVTVTDERGGSASAEIEITVEDPPGNVPPMVTAAADPRTGTAPLTVSFTSAAKDPDGDQVSSVWDFGDGVRAGGQNAVHTYTTPGTYTATVTVTDPRGATDTDSVQIVVSGAVGGASQPPVTGNQAPPPSVTKQSGPLVSVPKAKKVRSIIRRGLRYEVSCAEACRVSSVLRLSGRRLGASKVARISAGSSKTLVLRLDRKIRRNLLAAMRNAGVKRLTATVVTKIVTADGTKKMRAKVALKL